MKLLIAFAITFNFSLGYSQINVLSYASDIFQTTSDPQRSVAYIKIYENGSFSFDENSKIYSYSPPIAGNWSFKNDTLYLEYDSSALVDSTYSIDCITIYRLFEHELQLISTSDHTCRVNVKSLPFHLHISATFISEEQKILRND